MNFEFVKPLPPQENPLGTVDVPVKPVQEDPTKPSRGETFIGGQYKQNPIVAGSVKAQNYVSSLLDGEQAVPGYDPFNNVDDIAGYPPSMFINSNSPKETERLKAQYDNDNLNEHIMQTAGWEGTVSQVAGGAMNPLYLVPFLGWGGKAAGTGVARMAAEGAAGEVITESLYQGANLDMERTATESVFNIAAGAMASGILGGLLKRGTFSPEQYDEVVSKMTKEFEFVGPTRPRRAKGNDRVDLNTMEAPEQLKGVQAFISKLTPIRILASVSPVARKMGALLGEQTVVGTTRAAIEGLVKQYDGHLSTGLQALNDNYRLYGARVKNGMKRADFDEELANALRNGDVHAIPEIQAAAKAMRTEVMEPIRKAAVEAGLLKNADDYVKFAKSYFPRQYNFAKITANRDEFVNDIANWIRDNHVGFDEGDILEAARETARNIDGDALNPIQHRDVKIKSGALKGRKLQVPDDILKKWLINEPGMVLRSWTRDMATNIEFQRMFGDTSLAQQIKEVEADWDKIITEASKTDPKLAHKYDNMKKNDIVTIRALRDRLQGTHGIPENPNSVLIRTMRSIRNLNVARLLGGMTLSALPDMARPLYHHHMKSYAKAIHAVAANKEFRNMAVADLRRMGVGLDMTLNTRLRSIGELDYMPMSHSRLEAGIDWLVTGGKAGKYDFGKLSLMSPWNTMMKTFAGIMSQDGLIMRAGQFNKYEKTLKQLGISPQMARRIRDQYKQFGTKDQGLRIGNSDKWVDTEAAEIFETTILKEVDGTIVTPGIMDKPFMLTSTEFGKVIGQFRSFGFAATNKQLLAGLNNPTGMFVQGILASTTLGAMTYMVKRTMAGHEPDMEPEELLMHAIDYSGVIGMGGEAVQMAAGMSQAAGIYKGDGNWRWARQGMWGSVLGPTASLVEGGLRAGRVATKDDPNAGDVASLRRILPYNNLFYSRMLFDNAEQAYKDRLGIED